MAMFKLCLPLLAIHPSRQAKSIGSYYPDTENTPNEWQGKWSNKKAGKCATRMGLWLGIVNTRGRMGDNNINDSTLQTRVHYELL